MPVDEPLLDVVLDGETVCSISGADLPCERNVDVRLKAGQSVLGFRQPSGTVEHALNFEQGWGHFSIRVFDNLACQADCVISDAKELAPEAFAKGEIAGVRLQPLFLDGATVKNSEFRGQGLFTRGLHFAGTVSPGNLSLSCLCDECRRSFRLRSFHTGFADVAYFYSESGRSTLVVPTSVEGAPAVTRGPMSDAALATLAAFERRLPKAQDGTSYAYLNPLRCPHCSAPFIDFMAHPAIRPGEYYGNVFFGEKPERYPAGD